MNTSKRNRLIGNLAFTTMILMIVGSVAYGFWWKYGNGHEARYAEYAASAKAEAQHNLEDARRVIAERVAKKSQ